MIETEKVQRPVCPEDATSIDGVYWGLAFLEVSKHPVDALQVVQWFDNAIRAGYRAGAGPQAIFPGDD